MRSVTHGIIIGILWCYCGHAQNSAHYTKVSYTTSLEKDLSGQRFSELLFTSSHACYIEGEFKVKTTQENAIVKEEAGNELKVLYYTNQLEKKLYTRDKLDKKIVYVEEKTPVIAWEIHQNSVQSIMGLTCVKATGSFRGREYTVYFTPDIPVPFGPWKLQGLPGLILEAKDHLNQVHFMATKIKQYKEELPKEFFRFQTLDKNKIITLQEYVTQRDKEIQAKVRKLIATMPRESKVNNSKSYKYQGLELTYEWEE
ncbi:MAG TPA: GLPGLI family protein [Flavobacteriaceae bacterium]|nr:GLPGLI family protein [Flavobacteriaceae bacterium]